MGSPVMKLVIHQETNQSGNKSNKALLQNKTKEADMIKSIISALPHALLMTLFSDGKSLWSSLEEEHLKINSDDITLKHGATFAGHWYVLVVLDAKPDDEMEQSAFALTTGNGLFEGMVGMLSAIRTFLGRPADAYGITPVAIFRTVSTNSNS